MPVLHVSERDWELGKNYPTEMALQANVKETLRGAAAAGARAAQRRRRRAGGATAGGARAAQLERAAGRARASPRSKPPRKRRSIRAS